MGRSSDLGIARDWKSCVKLEIPLVGVLPERVESAVGRNEYCIA